MAGWDRDELRSANDGLKREMDSVWQAVEHQHREMSLAYERLAAERLRASSRDGLVEVTVNSAGVVLAVEIAPVAFRRLTAATLGRSMAEAAQRAARKAQEATRAALAPVTAVADSAPDLDDLFPGAPSLKDLRRRLFPDPDDDAAADPDDNVPPERDVRGPGPIGSHRDDDGHDGPRSWTQPIR